MAKVRPYVFYDTATSLCDVCLRRAEAKLVIRDGQVWMLKWCPEHGSRKVLIATDAEYWRMAREVYLKPPEMPRRFATPMRYGCPYDCGLCPDHMQHSCLTILEITDHCNLRCPVCYAGSGPHRQETRSLEVVERMLDAIVASEGEPDVVQISGGEPTLHPQFFEILDAARRRPIRHLMVNTNGIRIANEPGFAEKLAAYAPGFEVYLQFDSLRAEALKRLRGADLTQVRARALENLNRVGLSTTLVVTVARGVNEDELGDVVEFATKQPCVRGVTIQPVQHAGRTDDYDPRAQRLTLTEVRSRLLAQTNLFRPEDIIPVPCNPDALAMAYAIRRSDGLVPLTGYLPPEVLLSGQRSTIAFERDGDLKEKIVALFSTSRGPEGQARGLADLLCCLPEVVVPEKLGYADVFRVLIMQFIDAHDFDVRAVKRSCVHIVQPDGRLIPFEPYNLLYRDADASVLARRREEFLRMYDAAEPVRASDSADDAVGEEDWR